jgi:hypothetical protein
LTPENQHENIIQGTYNIQDYLENVAKRINKANAFPNTIRRSQIWERS